MIQASRASECQYRELTAAVAAMEAKSSYWRSVDLDWNKIVWTAYREQLSPDSYFNINTRQASLRVYSLLEQYEEIDNNLFTFITKLRRSNSTAKFQETTSYYRTKSWPFAPSKRWEQAPRAPFATASLPIGRRHRLKNFEHQLSR